jgi:hypothetical protein
LRAMEPGWNSAAGNDRGTRQGGAFRRPLYRTGEHRLALGADASLTKEPGAAVTSVTAGATFETAAVETPVAIDAVVAAEGSPANRRALRVCRARPAEGDIAATQTAADRLANASGTIETATTLGSSRAAATFVAAAIQRTVAGDPVVIAEDRSSHLAAFARLGALPTESDGAATTTRGSADSIRADQATAADDVAITRAAIVVAAVQDAVGVDPVRRADRRPCRLAALSGLRAFGAERQPTGPVVRAETIHAVESTATSSAVIASRTGAAFIAAAVQRTVAVIAVVSADRRSAALAALFGRRALRPGSESTRRRRPGRGATTGAIHTVEVRAALDVVCACATGIAAAVARAIGSYAVAGADDRSATLATFAGCGALGAERPAPGADTAAARAAEADRPAAAVEVRGASTSGVTAAVELTVANNAVIAADDGASSLTALGVGTERGTLPAEGNRVLCQCKARHANR